MNSSSRHLARLAARAMTSTPTTHRCHECAGQLFSAIDPSLDKLPSQMICVSDGCRLGGFNQSHALDGREFVELGWHPDRFVRFEMGAVSRGEANCDILAKRIEKWPGVSAVKVINREPHDMEVRTTENELYRLQVSRIRDQKRFHLLSRGAPVRTDINHAESGVLLRETIEYKTKRTPKSDRRDTILALDLTRLDERVVYAHSGALRRALPLGIEWRDIWAVTDQLHPYSFREMGRPMPRSE